MKRLSLTSRLVLLHTGMMTLIICVVMFFLFSASRHEILSTLQSNLEYRVEASFDLVTYHNGRLEFESELMELENDVYLSVYDANQELLYGRLPYGFAYGLELTDGVLQTVSSDSADFYVLDRSFQVEGYQTLFIRGIASVTDAQRNFHFTLRLTLILLPLLILLTAVCGYLLSRRALSPVSRMTQAVRNIQRDKDLSKRIRLRGGSDEIYTLAQTFDELLDTIEAGIQREKQFTSDVSHELRTPLTVIYMQCEDLLAHDGLDPQASEEVGRIYRKVKALSEMISQLLLLSRADQGRAVLHMEPVELSELVETVAEEFTDIAAEKQITLKTSIQPGLTMTADPMLLIRLLSNLLQNAVTYGKQAGHIWVTLAREGGSLRLCVADDGIGITAEQLPHIWERFYRADPSRNSSQNSGLGLSMAKWIVEAHEGKIYAQSEPQKQTVFSCIFPACH